MARILCPYSNWRRAGSALRPDLNGIGRVRHIDDKRTLSTPHRTPRVRPFTVLPDHAGRPLNWQMSVFGLHGLMHHDAYEAASLTGALGPQPIKHVFWKANW
jgi:hypothetical protein